MNRAPLQSETIVSRRLRVLFIGGFDSTNGALVEVIREFSSRGHSCTLVVEDPSDALNNAAFVGAGIPLNRVATFDLGSLDEYDVAFSGPFLRRPLRRIHAAIAEKGLFLISFATLLSSVSMRVPADLVLTSSTSKFDELERYGLGYRMIAIGNPQYDPLVRALSSGQWSPRDRIRRVLVIDQGAYPLGATGKAQFASLLTSTAANHPHIEFTVKLRYPPSYEGVQLHTVSEDLAEYLRDAPCNVVVEAEPRGLEEVVLEHDAMIAMWSTAYLDAAVLGMPLLLVEGLESVDVYDVRLARVEEVYRHLRSTGCVVDHRDLAAGELQFNTIAREFVEGELHEPEGRVAPRVVEIAEALCVTLADRGRSLSGTVRMGYREFLSALANDELTTVPKGSRADVLMRELYGRTNEIVQELVFQDRCMGSVLDMPRLLPSWRLSPSIAEGERGIDRMVAQVRAEADELMRRFFAENPDCVHADRFIQDAYFDWLRVTGQRTELLSYSGPVVCPESLAYNQGLAWLRRGRPFRALDRLMDSFDLSLRKPVRELRKDRNVSLVLTQSDRTLLGYPILWLLRAYGKWEGLAGLEPGVVPGRDATVLARMRALVALGRTWEAIALNGTYEMAPQARSAAGRSPAKMLLSALVSIHRVMRRAYAQRLGRRAVSMHESR